MIINKEMKRVIKKLNMILLGNMKIGLPMILLIIPCNGTIVFIKLNCRFDNAPCFRATIK